ncbi:hypothetical protein WJX73_010143 [Symbiochloris irregularis]|uniref:Uncharacterized protein n=1 Tax=Symbiochloris irregularis TaxID=706552 RepID=A0AAW1PUF7_9CHLO
MAYHLHKTRCSTTLLYDETKAFTILLIIRGVRRSMDGVFLMEIQFLCIARDDCPPQCTQALKDATLDGTAELVQDIRDAEPHDGKLASVSTIRSLEAKLFKEVLLENAARLSPEYKRQCKREWGIEDGPFDVSFLARPAASTTLRYLKDLDWLEAAKPTCALSTCDQAGSSHCGRCKVMVP